MVRDLRPQAQIDIETMLGAVLGAHAGPGTVGFFWFADDAVFFRVFVCGGGVGAPGSRPLC